MPAAVERCYSVYLVRCANGSLYTGISTDVDRRLREHAVGQRGARFLRGKGPLELVYQARVGSRSEASRVECRLKQLDRAQKEALVAGTKTLFQLVAGRDGQTTQASGTGCA